LRAFSGESEPRIALPSTLLANCWRTGAGSRPTEVGQVLEHLGLAGQRSRLCLGVAYSRVAVAVGVDRDLERCSSLREACDGCGVEQPEPGQVGRRKSTDPGKALRSLAKPGAAITRSRALRCSRNGGRGDNEPLPSQVPHRRMREDLSNRHNDGGHLLRVDVMKLDPLLEDTILTQPRARQTVELLAIQIGGTRKPNRCDSPS